MFKKVFNNWNEALNYTYVDYGRSVYYSFQGENLPKVKGGVLMKEWCSGCPVERIHGVHFEVTPLWVTITIVEKDGATPLTKNFERKNRSVNAVLHEVFGWKRYNTWETGEIFYLLSFFIIKKDSRFQRIFFLFEYCFNYASLLYSALQNPRIK